MTDPRQAMQMALDALHIGDFSSGFGHLKQIQAIDALRAALSAQQEPVGHIASGGDIAYGVVKWCAHQGPPVRIGAPLYTNPAPTVQPLTDKQIMDAFHAARNAKLGASQDNSAHRLSVIEIARAIERAHGIGGTHG